MKKRRMIVFWFIITIVSVMFTYNNASAYMQTEYPNRFYLTGLVELRYLDDFYETTVKGQKNQFHSPLFEQEYHLDIHGFIYHPRLAVFTAGITYNDSRGLVGKTNSHDIGGNFSLTFLPYRPISFDIYGNKTYITVDSFPFGTQNTTSSSYGARLKIRNLFLPLIRIEYNHQEFGSINWGYKPFTTVIDEYELDIRGDLKKFLHTGYRIFFQVQDVSGTAYSFKTKYLQVYTGSTVREGIFLMNSLNYSDIDSSKFFGFNTQLDLNHHERFNQFYTYTYSQSQQKFPGLPEQGIAGLESKETINSLTGSWNYRFPFGLHSSLGLNYGLRNTNGDNANFYGIGAGVSYGKPLFGLNLSPRYHFIYRKDEIRGDLLEHDFTLNLVTQNFRWGTLYSNYDLLVSKEKSITQAVGTDSFEKRVTKIDMMTHSLRTGIRGRGPGKLLSRAQWGLHGDIFYSTATIERPKTVSLFDATPGGTSETERINKKISRYSLRGDVSYPLGWATVFFNTEYTLGKSDSRGLRRFFYEERINYPAFRNLRLAIRWKELWEKVEGIYDEKTQEYELLAEYLLGRTTLSLEGRVTRTKLDDSEFYARRFFFRIRRPI